MKQKLLAALLTASLLCGLSAPAAKAAGGPGLSCELAAGDTALTLTLTGLDPASPVYAVQVELPLPSSGAALDFYPDGGLTADGASEDFYYRLNSEWRGEERIAVLYLDSMVPINLSDTVELGTLASDGALATGSSARLIIVKGQMEGTSFDDIPLSGGTTPPAPSPSPSSSPSPSTSPAPDQPSGGGGGAQPPQPSQTVTATPDQDGLAVLSQKELSSAQRVEVRGDVRLVLEGPVLDALRSAGGEVRIRTAPTQAGAQSRAVRAQLYGAAFYELALTSNGTAVPVEGGSIQVSAPFSGKGRPVAYLVGDGGLTKIGSAALKDGYASFALSLGEARFAILDVVHGFDDVDGWYDGYVNTVAAAGVMNGVSETAFKPDQATTRAELVAMLARLSGDALPPDAGGFADVPSDAWFAPYVAWAKETGVTSGVSEELFLPQGVVTREQVATMLVRFAAARGLDLGQEQTPAEFPDGALISDFARDAVSLMQRAGILSGKADGRFDPQGTATRAECAKMLAVVLQAMER